MLSPVGGGERNVTRTMQHQLHPSAQRYAEWLWLMGRGVSESEIVVSASRSQNFGQTEDITNLFVEPGGGRPMKQRVNSKAS